MFGYVRPLKCELRVREWEHFQSAYCGLCHTLAHGYGWWARYLLNYDFTFLALALSVYEPFSGKEAKRCPASPHRKKACLNQNQALAAAADLTILLTWHKLRDSVLDESVWRSIPARAGMLFLSRAERRAAQRQAPIAQRVAEELSRLRAYERERPDSFDPPADTFAALLSALADVVPEEGGRRVLRLLFYHLGRWIYLLDACDDLAADARKGAYNPVAARFGLAEGILTADARERIQETLRLSRLEMETAFALAPDSPFTPVLGNIIVLGLPSVEEQVLSGQWKQRRTRHERPL